MGLAARESGDLRREFLGNRIDRIRSHGVPDINMEVNDQEGMIQRCLEDADVDTARPAPSPRHARSQLVDPAEEVLACRFKGVLGSVGIRHIDQLDLRDHRRWIAMATEATAVESQTGGIGCRGDHRRFLGDHRDKTVSTIHPEVQRHAHREGVDPYGIFGELGGS